MNVSGAPAPGTGAGNSSTGVRGFYRLLIVLRFLEDFDELGDCGDDGGNAAKRRANRGKQCGKFRNIHRMYLSLLDCEYLNNRFDCQAWSVEVYPFNTISIARFILLYQVFQVFLRKYPLFFRGYFRVCRLSIYLMNFAGINLHLKYSNCDVLHINSINAL